MAKQSDKKRAERERKIGRYYTAAFVLSAVLWVLRVATDFYRSKLRHSKFGYLWRASLIALGFSASLYSIFSNLRLGLDFSLSNDLFIVTAVVAVLSVFADFAYYLFSVVPLYGLYKGSVAFYRWATAPPPAVPAGPAAPEPKKRVKYRTVRA